MKKITCVFSLVILFALPIFSQAVLSPKKASSFIRAELFKKGFEGLKVICVQSPNWPECHNVLIEFKAEERTTEEVDDICCEAALIIAAFHPKARYIRGLEYHPTFKVNTLRFTKMGKLACWIHADDCVKAILDGIFRTQLERKAFIFSCLRYEK
jgi:hypothetical protein